MKLRSIVRQYALEKAISIAFNKRYKQSPYALYLSDMDSDSKLKYYIYKIDNKIAFTKVIDNGKHNNNNIKEIDVNYIHNYKIDIVHSYKGWIFNYDDIYHFLFKRYTAYEWRLVTVNKIKQAIFNKKKLLLSDKMKVLNFILEQTLKDESYNTNAIRLMSEFYTNRWALRPDKDKIIRYYKFILKALEHSGDISKSSTSTYVLQPQAINSLTEYEKEERRHVANYKLQRRIIYLTIALVFVGFLQAGSSIYSAVAN